MYCVVLFWWKSEQEGAHRQGDAIVRTRTRDDGRILPPRAVHGVDCVSERVFEPLFKQPVGFVENEPPNAGQGQRRRVLHVVEQPMGRGNVNALNQNYVFTRAQKKSQIRILTPTQLHGAVKPRATSAVRTCRV